jgi:transposase-like protein
MANKKYKNVNKPFKWKHHVGELILWLVRWYSRYALSYRDLQEIAEERGLIVDRSTIYRWVQEYAPEINKRIKPHLKKTCDSWKCDETYIKIKGKWHYLYRAIDKNGNTLDWMLSRNRNKKSAKRFFKKMLNNSYTVDPRVINVDKSPTFPPALSEPKSAADMPKKTKLRAIKYLNNSMENDHKFTKSKSRYRQWYQSFASARKTLDGMEAMRMVQKGQIRYVGTNIKKQNDFICGLFGLSA